jgi:hypothetical protein
MGAKKKWNTLSVNLTCNINFAEVIDTILTPDKTLSSRNAPLKEWILLAKEESSWQTYIDN